jgi:hypothetical protein
MKRNYEPRHARPRERHPVTGLEITNTVLIALGDLISTLILVIALLALHQSPVVQTVAPAQFPAIVCSDGRVPEQCQVIEVRSPSP